MNHLCRICGTLGPAETYEAREQMFGLGECFPYFLCGTCGCLQIRDIPADLAKYYPKNYYSFGSTGGPAGRPLGGLARLRNAAALTPWSGPIGRALLHFKPNPPLQSLAHVKPSRHTRIADIGCGAGRLLHELHRLRFSHLTGVDPNISADFVVDQRLQIRKLFLEELPGEFDVIMFHHSLEHIPDQLGVLIAAHAKLSHHGTCLVRIPVVSSYAWRSYGTDWVQLDAPRHLYLHSVKSMQVLAERTGFVVDQVIHDSDDFQFWGSESFKRKLALFDAFTGRPNPATLELARRNRSRWRKQARDLNLQGDGDQAVFLLRKVVTSPLPHH